MLKLIKTAIWLLLWVLFVVAGAMLIFFMNGVLFWLGWVILAIGAILLETSVDWLCNKLF